jgi:hypothetical protein
MITNPLSTLNDGGIIKLECVTVKYFYFNLLIAEKFSPPLLNLAKPDAGRSSIE